MFHIYSPEGRIFSGTMEKLRQHNQLRTERTQRVDSSTQRKGNQDTNQDRYQETKNAIDQYADALPGRNSTPEAIHHAYQIMSNNITTLTQDQTWEDAYDLFVSLPFQAFPILNENQQLSSILTRRYFYEILLQNPEANKQEKNISEIMPKEVVTAEPATNVRRIAEVLVENKIDTVPVVGENHELLGIVSRTDILKSVINSSPISLWC